MERPFETPHPSIRTQDQIFKLPSSQPRYSPNLSPLPIANTRSRNLKENRVSRSWTEHTSKTLTSVSSSNSSSLRESKEFQIPTKKSLKANMKTRSSKPRNSKSCSRSGIDTAWALASPFISRASSPIDGQGSNPNPNDLLPPKPKLGKRGLSDTFYNPNLPSRSQTHILEGVHKREKGRIYLAQSAHTSPPSKGPPSVLLDLNTQLKQKRRKGGHRGTVSVDGSGAVIGYPQDLAGTTTKKHEGHKRERRTSAPSSYSRRPRPHALPLLIGASVGLKGSKTRRSRLPSGLEIIHNVNNDDAAFTSAGGCSNAGPAINHTDDDGFVLPLLPYLYNRDPTATTNSAESDMEMDWTMGRVDFNRPPSQMCHYPTTTTLSGWVGGDVFSSSGSEQSSSDGEEDDDDDEGIEGTQTMVNPTRASRAHTRTARLLTSASISDPFDFGRMLPDLDQSMFGDDAWGISTPLKMQIQMQTRKAKQGKAKKMMKATSTSDLRSKNHHGGLVRVRSLPVIHSMGVVCEGWMELNDHDQESDPDEEDEDPYEREQEKQEEQDMDLTTPLITADIDAGVALTTLGFPEVIRLEDKRGDITPWILDSLISPPSRFLNTQEEIGREYPHEKEESQGAGNLISKTSSSSSPEQHYLLSSPFQLSSDAYISIQSQPEATKSVTPVTTAATAVTSLTAKRTRSGTIVPSSHRISNNTNAIDPPGTRRTRSGTLVGPLPLPLAASGSGVQLVGNENLFVERTGEKSGEIAADLSPSLSAGAGARRTRSGTVIGCAPPIYVSAPASVSKSTKERKPGPEILEEDTSKSNRADVHHPGFDYDKNLDGSDIEVDMEGYVGDEPYIDALYMPRHSSSPDPIDFLRLAHFQDYDGMREKYYRRGPGFGFTIKGQEDKDRDHDSPKERMEDEMVWCIADEPPSPIVVKNESKLEMMRKRYNKGRVLGVGGGGYGGIRNGNNKRRRGKNAKEKGKAMRTRFMIDGHEEQPDEVVVEPEEGEDSDDELLLGNGSTWDIWE